MAACARQLQAEGLIAGPSKPQIFVVLQPPPLGDSGQGSELDFHLGKMFSISFKKKMLLLYLNISFNLLVTQGQVDCSKCILE